MNKEISELDVASHKVNKRNPRTRMIREAMPEVQSEMDWQEVAFNLRQNGEFGPLFKGKSEEQIEEYILGVIRFCETACHFNQY